MRTYDSRFEMINSNRLEDIVAAAIIGPSNHRSEEFTPSPAVTIVSYTVDYSGIAFQRMTTVHNALTRGVGLVTPYYQGYGDLYRRERLKQSSSHVKVIRDSDSQALWV